jgi:hypothetical protein
LRFVRVSATPLMRQSLRGLEAFTDTFNPLCFVIKFSAWPLAQLTALQSLHGRAPSGAESGA